MNTATRASRPARRRGRPLTGRQREILTVIHHFIGHSGFPPTLAEIAEELGCTVSTAQGHVDRLIRKGALDRGEGEQRRTLRITDDDFLKEHGPSSLSGVNDDEMVAELERRGYKVTVRRVRGRR